MTWISPAKGRRGYEGLAKRGARDYGGCDTRFKVKISVKYQCQRSTSTLNENWKFFRTEAEACAQFLFAFLAVHDVANRKKAVHKLLNRAPLFWNTCLGALQASAFIALGRVFDSNSPHNINQLLRMAQGNRTQLFSKAALGRRKQGSKPQPPEWLPDFLRSAHEPSADDFRRIVDMIFLSCGTFDFLVYT
jgi:hypothetical protein